MSLTNAYLGHDYQLLHQIGSGGTGTLYLARDTRGPRRVVAKVVPVDEAFERNSAATRRIEKLFHEKMQAIERFEHPAILPVLDSGQSEIDTSRYFYVVMEYCPAGSLEDWLSQAPHTDSCLPFSEIASFLSQAAGALHYAHERGVIHQDVKPTNFLISASAPRPNRPEAFPDFQLADFGIAHFFASLSSRGLSQSPYIRSTAMFIAPEQWDGEGVPASDQYALAILAFRLLTGRFPFQGSPGQIIRQHYQTPPPAPSSLNPQLDPFVDKIIMRALAKQPAQRFSSMLDLAHVFASIQQIPDDQRSFQQFSGSRPSPGQASSAPTEDAPASENAPVASPPSEQTPREAAQSSPSVPVDILASETLIRTPLPSSPAASTLIERIPTSTLTQSSPSAETSMLQDSHPNSASASSSMPAVSPTAPAMPSPNEVPVAHAPTPAASASTAPARLPVSPGKRTPGWTRKVSVSRKGLLIALLTLIILGSGGAWFFRSTATAGPPRRASSPKPVQTAVSNSIPIPVTATTAPAAPTHLHAVDGDGQVILTWKAPRPGLWYWIYLRNITTGQSKYTRTVYPVTSGTTLTMHYLVNGNTYQFYVTAINSKGESAPSKVVQATPFVPLSGPPTHLHAVAGNGKVALSWEAPRKGLWYWIYYRDVSKGQTRYTRTVYPVTSGTALTLSYLNNGDTYAFYVTAINSRGESAPSNVVSAKPLPPLPSAPTGLKASANSNGSIALSWTAPGPGLWYWIYYRDVSKGQTRYTRSVDPVTTGTSFNLSYLTSNDTYAFYITAINVAGEGPTSNVVTVRDTP